MKSVLISPPPCFYDSQLQIMCCYIERHYVHEGGGGRNRIDPKIARASSILQLCYSNDYYCKNRHYGSLIATNNKKFLHRGKESLPERTNRFSRFSFSVSLVCWLCRSCLSSPSPPSWSLPTASPSFLSFS